MPASLRTFRIFLLLLFIIIAAFHGLGFAYSLYFHIWWYDIPMHLLGGFAAGLFAGYAFYLRGLARVSASKILHVILLSVFVVGVFWEIYEYVVSRYFGFTWYGGFDTFADLINDLLGAYLAYGIFRKFYASFDGREQT